MEEDEGITEVPRPMCFSKRQEGCGGRGFSATKVVLGLDLNR